MKRIFVTFQLEGIHNFPAALTDEKFKTGGWDDVSFLGHPHRHMFHFRVEIDVMHNDREIEFIQFKRWLLKMYGEDVLKLNNKSCEMLADELAHEIQKRYPNRTIRIEISEDGENGAIAEYI